MYKYYLCTSMDNKTMIIAIDGYSSCGKSTVARALAERLGYTYVDSGAMYRAVTYFLLNEGIAITDLPAIRAALPDIHIELQKNEGNPRVILNDEDITEKIREMRISEVVSEVSAIREVREAMVSQQQRMAANRNIVMDGRDIGTAVFPQAQVKIFMTADPKIRADRRHKELLNAGKDISLEEVFENLAHRDYQDTTRTASPLVRAEDAIVLDNSAMTEEEQLNFVISEVKKAVRRKI
jgi:cytidylate kinase